MADEVVLRLTESQAQHVCFTVAANAQRTRRARAHAEDECVEFARPDSEHAERRLGEARANVTRFNDILHDAKGILAMLEEQGVTPK